MTESLRRLRVAALLSLLALAACATVATGPSFSEAKAPPPPAGMATVYVYRKHAEPLAWGTTIHFGAHEIATLSQGGFTWVHVPRGALSVRATWPALSGQSNAALELQVEPDRAYFIEVRGVSRGFCIGVGCMVTRIGSQLSEVDAEAAAEVVQRCCKYQKSTSLD